MPTSRQETLGKEFDWFAIDSAGELAACSSAGWGDPGPITICWLAEGHADSSEHTSRICSRVRERFIAALATAGSNLRQATVEDVHSALEAIRSKANHSSPRVRIGSSAVTRPPAGASSVSCAAEATRVCLNRAGRAPCERLPVCATLRSGPSFPDSFQAEFQR
jgi:hypothetical protein